MVFSFSGAGPVPSKLGLQYLTLDCMNAIVHEYFKSGPSPAHEACLLPSPGVYPGVRVDCGVHLGRRFPDSGPQDSFHP